MKNFLQEVGVRFCLVIITTLSVLHAAIVLPIFWFISIVCLFFLKEETGDKIIEILKDNLLIWPYKLLGIKNWTDFCNSVNNL